MSSENNSKQQQEIDNIYLVRFKILDEFYGDYFYDKYGDNTAEILNILKKELNVNYTFLQRNLDYLTECGYLGSGGITFKGIKFIELVTDGRLNFDYEQVKNQEPFIVRKFQELDTLK